MTVITVTEAAVAKAAMSDEVEIHNHVAAEDITAGMPVYINANGKVGIADGNGSSPINRFRGIALESRKAGQPVAVLVRGKIYGYDLSGLGFDAAVYVSDTAGSLDTAAGTTSLVVGRVAPLPKVNAVEKVLYVTGFAG